VKRVLVISHNVFCKTSSMGKTLLSYFKYWDCESIAQLYIHSEIPTDSSCVNYYRVTDKDMIKSIVTRRSGTILGRNEIQLSKISSRTDTGFISTIYQKSRKRTPIIYLMRNFLWRLGVWKTKKLRDWLLDFKPEAIFFASGDYAFLYVVADRIAQICNIPLYICCMDDYYINNKNKGRIGGKVTHKLFMKQVKKTVSNCSAMFTICEKMRDDYFNMFKVPCYTLHTASSFVGPLKSDKKEAKLSYIGNLGYKRYEQIIAIGKALKSLESELQPMVIDVYSSERRPEILKNLTLDNGIRFCGEISAEEVKNVMARSMFLIHTESFDQETRKAVAYSVSTKIADSLASGTCLIAYGPKEVASIKYLFDNNAAFCIFEEDDLRDKLKEIIFDVQIQNLIVGKAIALSRVNHNSEKSFETIKTRICGK